MILVLPNFKVLVWFLVGVLVVSVGYSGYVFYGTFLDSFSNAEVTYVLDNLSINTAYDDFGNFSTNETRWFSWGKTSSGSHSAVIGSDYLYMKTECEDNTGSSSADRYFTALNLDLSKIGDGTNISFMVDTYGYCHDDDAVSGSCLSNMQFRVNDSGNLRVLWASAITSFSVISGGTTSKTSDSQNITIQRNGTDFIAYQNGSLVKTTSTSGWGSGTWKPHFWVQSNGLSWWMRSKTELKVYYFNTSNPRFVENPVNASYLFDKGSISSASYIGSVSDVFRINLSGEVETPVGTGIDFWVSSSNGSNWTSATLNSLTDIPVSEAGNVSVWRANFSTSDLLVTPFIYWVNLSVLNYELEMFQENLTLVSVVDGELNYSFVFNTSLDENVSDCRVVSDNGSFYNVSYTDRCVVNFSVPWNTNFTFYPQLFALNQPSINGSDSFGVRFSQNSVYADLGSGVSLVTGQYFLREYDFSSNLSYVVDLWFSDNVSNRSKISGVGGYNVSVVLDLISEDAVFYGDSNAVNWKNFTLVTDGGVVVPVFDLVVGREGFTGVPQFQKEGVGSTFTYNDVNLTLTLALESSSTVYRYGFPNGSQGGTAQESGGGGSGKPKIIEVASLDVKPVDFESLCFVHPLTSRDCLKSIIINRVDSRCEVLEGFSCEVIENKIKFGLLDVVVGDELFFVKSSNLTVLTPNRKERVDVFGEFMVINLGYSIGITEIGLDLSGVPFSEVFFRLTDTIMLTILWFLWAWNIVLFW